ncbi:MAG TPA: hypothetical protein VH143_04540 [Kofleriaceae bacterium]|jgi:hypothetical protein|nr:hypothetical protein [Kofleriaceae bacterium]
MRQEPEQVPARAIGVVALAIVAVIVASIAVTWELVAPTPAYMTLPPTTLEHGTFDPYGDHQLGSAVLDRDRAIEAAIDAVVADPSLIGGHK